MDLTQGGPSPAAPLEDMMRQPAVVRMAVVDSDSGFTQMLAKRLAAVGWRMELLGSPPPVEELASMRLHAVVIDPAMLGREAWSYLERLCAASNSQVVIVCTGPSSVAQRVRGLRLGADDWISKPCHAEEVLARIEASVRRRNAGVAASQAVEPISAGELEIRADMFEAYVGGLPVGLTRREFELLRLVAEAAGRVIPREGIYERVWGYSMVRGDRSVDVFVRKLRRKLEAASPTWRYLHTHFGVGYRFEAQPASDTEEGKESETAEAVEAEGLAEHGGAQRDR